MSMNPIELLRLCQTTLSSLHPSNLKLRDQLDEFLSAPPLVINPYDALCLWEEYLENPGYYPNITAFREDQGSAATRDLILSWVEPMQKIFAATLEEGWESPFDFEFVPLFLKHCTNATSDDPEQSPTLLVTPEFYDQMGQYLALLDKANQMTSMTIQSIRKISGAGSAKAFSVSEIKKWAGF